MAAIFAVSLVVVIAILVLPNMFSISSFLSQPQSTSTYVVSPANQTGVTASPNSTVEIGYPSNYQQLQSYALAIINENRTSSGLDPVTLSPIPSGQQHADSMLTNGYFSHWDTQGYKPYMRYSVLSGTGFVEENVAYEFTSLPEYTSTHTIERAIGSLEWQMMNNDSGCCNNGHRDNILTFFHNRVSIGIAYDATHVYFVEDFETFLTTLNTPISQGNTVNIVGNTSGNISPTSILIFYDPVPTTVSSSELNSNYYGPYGQGSFLGGVVPPCNGIFSRCLQFSQGVTEDASVWQVNGNSIDIQFSLSNFAQKNGNGVYTVYLVQGTQNNPEFLTSISIFVSS
ncbi:MAG: CAP domain-containing protein [Thaumarchaeota archaeon]|nr:CAP domain-containing protein [Nitrososphaerota archaeon]